MSQCVTSLMNFCPWYPQAPLSAPPQWKQQQQQQQVAASRSTTKFLPWWRQARVMKPRSAGNSPSIMMAGGCRRAHSTGQARYGRGGGGRQQSSNLANKLGVTPTSATATATTSRPRPFSWHPTAAGESSRFYQPVQFQSYQSAYDPCRLFAYSDMPMPSGYMANTTTLPMDQPSSLFQPFQWDTDGGLPNIPQTEWSMNPLDNYLNPPPLSMPLESNNYEYPMTTTTDFFPYHQQQFDVASGSGSDWKAPEQQQQQVLPENDGKSTDEGELVGMGLYNEPPEPEVHEEQEDQSLLSGMLGKGLKLEETFTPSSDDNNNITCDGDSDDDDEKEKAASSSYASTRPPESTDDTMPSFFTTSSSSSNKQPSKACRRSKEANNDDNNMNVMNNMNQQISFFDNNGSSSGGYEATLGNTGSSFQNLLSESQQWLNVGTNPTCTGYCGWI